VRFGTSTNESGTEQAVSVHWVNGQPVPPERTNYLGGVHERAKRILGESVYDLLAAADADNSDGKSDEELLKQVRALQQQAKTSIENGEAFVRQLGMDPKDFPVIKSSTGRGKYLFKKEDDKAKGSASTTESAASTAASASEEEEGSTTNASTATTTTEETVQSSPPPVASQ